MPISLVCRRCGTEVHHNDAFCQECGLKVPGAEANNAPADQSARAAEEAFGLQSPRAGNNNGAAPNSEIADRQIENFETSDRQNARVASRLNSPLFSTGENPELDKLGWRGGWHIVFTDFAAVLAVLAFALMLANFAIQSFKNDEQTHVRNQINSLSRKVKSAAAKQDYGSVVEGLSYLRTKHTLDAREQALLDESSFRLAQDELAKGEKKNAIEHLKTVSVLSDYYVGAQETLFNLTLPVVQASSADAVKTVKRVRRTSTTQQASAQAQAQAQAMPRAGLSDEPVLSIPRIPEIESRKDNAEDASASSQAAEAAPLLKFSESEISRYNRLLGSYFSRQRAKKSSAEHPEPPSFKEWIKDGKPSF